MKIRKRSETCSELRDLASNHGLRKHLISKRNINFSLLSIQAMNQTCYIKNDFIVFVTFNIYIIVLDSSFFTFLVRQMFTLFLLSWNRIFRKQYNINSEHFITAFYNDVLPPTTIYHNSIQYSVWPVARENFWYNYSFSRM